jgi:hypothetical protein
MHVFILNKILTCSRIRTLMANEQQKELSPLLVKKVEVTEVDKNRNNNYDPL